MFHLFIIPHLGRMTHMGNYKIADVCGFVCGFVGLFVRPESNLRDGWIDVSEIIICYSLVPQDDARLCGISQFDF